jgi:hypothetical protein
LHLSCIHETMGGFSSRTVVNMLSCSVLAHRDRASEDLERLDLELFHNCWSERYQTAAACRFAPQVNAEQAI